MPLAIIAGLAFLALEVAALAWLFHWFFNGTVGIIAIAVVIALGSIATLIVWASVMMASRADTEMDRFMADGEPPETAHDSGAKNVTVIRKPLRSTSSVPSNPHPLGANGVALDLTHEKGTGNRGLPRPSVSLALLFSHRRRP